MAELANVSVQMIKRIEGRKTWVGYKMLANLAAVLGVKSFQLLVPSPPAEPDSGSLALHGLLNNLRQNLKAGIDAQFDGLLPAG